MGPVFWVLLETSITKGFKAAVAFDLGVMFADVCFIGICYLGSFQLLEDDQNKQGLFVLGGTILLLYGLFSWINRNKKSKDQPEIQESKENYFGLAAKGFAINILNVGVFIFWGGVTIVSSPRHKFIIWTIPTISCSTSNKTPYIHLLHCVGLSV